MNKLEPIIATIGTGAATAGAELLQQVNGWFILAVNSLTLLWWIKLWCAKSKDAPPPPKMQK